MSTQERLGTVAVEPESAPDAYEAVTVFQATNADTTSIRAGRYDDTEVLEEPELQGKTPISTSSPCSRAASSVSPTEATSG